MTTLFWVNIDAPMIYHSNPGTTGYSSGGFATTMADFFSLHADRQYHRECHQQFFQRRGDPRRPSAGHHHHQAGRRGGPFTVTWQHNASPSVTAPTILWAGGTAPTMTATASAVDVYKLETPDGITWYGQAIQHVS